MKGIFIFRGYSYHHRSASIFILITEKSLTLVTIAGRETTSGIDTMITICTFYNISNLTCHTEELSSLPGCNMQQCVENWNPESLWFWPHPPAACQSAHFLSGLQCGVVSHPCRSALISISSFTIFALLLSHARCRGLFPLLSQASRTRSDIFSLNSHATPQCPPWHARCSAFLPSASHCSMSL